MSSAKLAAILSRGRWVNVLYMYLYMTCIQYVCLAKVNRYCIMTYIVNTGPYNHIQWIEDAYKNW